MFDSNKDTSLVNDFLSSFNYKRSRLRVPQKGSVIKEPKPVELSDVEIVTRAAAINDYSIFTSPYRCLQNEIYLFPHRNNTDLEFEFDLDNIDSVQNIEISTVSGQVLYTTNINNAYKNYNVLIVNKTNDVVDLILNKLRPIYVDLSKQKKNKSKL